MERAHGRALAGWTAVVGLVVALLLAPSSSGAGSNPSLEVTPGSGSYGGQRVHWQGNIGSTGVQEVHLQRRGNPTAAWADVPDSTFRTRADGSFDFDFPAPAMNGVYFRVAGARGATPAHRFETVHQDVEVAVVPSDPSAADVPLPRGFAVVGEAYSLVADTTRAAAGERKPVLAGRKVVVQVRRGEVWSDVATGSLGRDGTVDVGRFGPGALPQTDGFHRVVLADWTEDGDRVGWFPSLPLRVRLVHRPRPLGALVAVAAANRVVLTWIAPADEERAAIVVARRSGRDSEDPSAAYPSQVVARLGAAVGTYVDLDVDPGRTYKYAVYAVSDEGVYSAVPVRVQTTVGAG